MSTAKPPEKTTVDRTRVAASGAWMVVYSVTGRIARFAGQIALAWLLVPESIALIGIANIINALVNIASQFGLADVLVSRSRKLDLWSGPAFWLSILVGLLSSVVMIVSGVVSAHIYNEPLLGWVLILMAFTAIISAAGILPFAKLRGEMRFREVATIQSISVVIEMAGAVLFAYLGFGIFCIASGRLLGESYRTAEMMRLSGVRLPRNFLLRRAKYLLNGSVHVYTQSFSNNVVLQSDYLMLGLLVPKAIVGYYVMAYSLSIQAISMLALNLNTVLLSAFTSFADSPERLKAAFLRSSRFLAFSCAPICLFQVAAAAPAVHLVLSREWYAVIPLARVLSIGTAFRCASFSWEAMLKAQGKFSLIARFSAVTAAVFVVAIFIGSYWGGAIGCCLAGAAYYSVISPLQMLIAMRFEKGSFAKICDLTLRPLAVATLTYGLAWLAAKPLRDAGSNLLELLVIGCLGALLYLGVSALVNAEPLRDLTDVIMRTIRRKPTATLSTNA